LGAQFAADPLDPETILCVHRCSGSSRCRAVEFGRENADAVRRISFARRSSAFSLFSRRISACSSAVTPDPVPASISERRSHLRSVSLFTLSRDATAWIGPTPFRTAVAVEPHPATATQLPELDWELLRHASSSDRGLNVVSIGLTVFGPNKAAQSLCEDLGFEVTVLQMRKPIDGLTGANTATAPESLSDESEQPGRLLLTTTNAVHGA